MSSVGAWLVRVAAPLAEGGLDLVQPFRVGAYNAEVAEGWRLPDFGRPASLGLLIGNSRALWPRFVEVLRREPWRRARPNPLDTYVEERVLAAIRALDGAAQVRFGHHGPPRGVALQRLAELSGLAPLAPSRLNIHPVFGPWIGLRAAIVIDAEGPETAPRPLPCQACEHACRPAFEAALAEGSADHAQVAERWQSWLAVRDACPLGREHRYGEAQIRYHYTKDPAALDLTGSP